MKVRRENADRSRKDRTSDRVDWRWWLVASALIAVIVAALATCHLRERSAPAPPQVNTTDFDPAIVVAIGQARDAVLNAPRSADSWGRYGMVLLAYDVRADASACFTQASSFAPDEPRWPYFLGIAQLSDNPLAAVTNLARAVQLFSARAPEPSAPRIRLADTLLTLGRTDQAETHYRHVWNQDTNSAPAALGLGKVANARNHPAEATGFLLRATRDPSTRKAAHRLLVGLYQRSGQTNQAAQLAPILAKLPNDNSLPDPIFTEVERLKTGLNEAIDRADEWIKTGRAADAAQLLESTLKTYPRSDRVLFFLGRARMRQGDLPGAEKMLQQTLEVSPDSVEALVQLGVIQMAQRRNKDAEQSFRNAIRIKPNLPEAWFNLGLSTGGQNRAESMAAFREAIRIKPNFIEAYLGLAVILRADGQPQAAAEELQRALALSPEEPLRQKLLDQLKLIGSP